MLKLSLFSLQSTKKIFHKKIFKKVLFSSISPSSFKNGPANIQVVKRRGLGFIQMRKYSEENKDEEEKKGKEEGSEEKKEAEKPKEDESKMHASLKSWKVRAKAEADAKAILPEGYILPEVDYQRICRFPDLRLDDFHYRFSFFLFPHLLGKIPGQCV